MKFLKTDFIINQFTENKSPKIFLFRLLLRNNMLGFVAFCLSQIVFANRQKQANFAPLFCWRKCLCSGRENGLFHNGRLFDLKRDFWDILYMISRARVKKENYVWWYGAMQEAGRFFCTDGKLFYIIPSRVLRLRQNVHSTTMLFWQPTFLCWLRAH